ncbi:Peroxisomal biogenesis factor 6 [Psilocybe cubensis]|uniref:Peroxisomal ATPase PEX6 n=2 Tax=Psilocybe cubensis TaxID=181762 RepID=A0A8H7Y4N7_PSICU|nr:Peroxisomal biogenesis factor 6 [Psilocybe cubensis]KAH9483816.1 Peroxisomal biogenesis factor 6 [Psilocybe cubensis]
MTFFFDNDQVLTSTWSFKEEEKSDDDAVVLLGHRLWQALSSKPASGRICISLAPVSSASDASNVLRSVLSWASLNDKDPNQPLLIPSAWVKKHPQIFTSSSRELFVKLEEPLTLTAVIVTALSDDAYEKASSEQSVVDTLLFNNHPILHEGDVLAYTGDVTRDLNKTRLEYRLELLEPVMQGIAAKGTTKIILMSSQNFESSTISDQDSSESTDGTQDAIEIDEEFLGSSVMNLNLDSPREHDAYTSDSSQDGEASWSGYTPINLSAPVDASQDDCTLYVRTADLGKLGLLSGYWAIAGIKPSSSRLVRIIANDDAVKSTGSLAGSPLLIHNTYGDEAESYARSPPQLSIRSSPFGSSNPAIPTARAITIARVASPASINRQYQPLFLESLKRHFASRKRLLKQGDVIAVSIDTDVARLNPDHEHGTFGTSRDFRPNEVVFFKVTNIEYDVVNHANSSVQDLYTGSTLGELGCWVDTSITRMIQTGIEHSRVPRVRSYMNIGNSKSYSRLLTLPASRLIGADSPYAKIHALTSAALSQRAMDYNLQLSFLLKGGRGIGKFTVASWVAESLGLHLLEVNCYDIIGDTDVKTEATLRVRLDQAKECTPCLLVLRNLEALSQTTQAPEPGKEPVIANVLAECLNDIQNGWKLTGYPVIVLGTTSESGRVPKSLQSCFKQEINIEAPDEVERLEILQCLVSGEIIGSDVSLQHVATQTAALLAGDLRDLVARAKAASIDRATSTSGLVKNDTFLRNIALSAADFDVALSKARESYSESIGAPKIPSVSWDDVGGLAHVKTDILDTIQLPLEHPELFADGLKKRSGILLYGPPGTGKTLIAKAVATSCSLNFFSVKGPELLNMYIGESEANVRRVFQRARDAKPCVIFFDELDSVAPKRGNQGDSGGVMDRIVSQLLAELDGMSGAGGGDVFVIGATNRPDLLDPALLRPGRFDRMLYLGVSDTHEAQLNILEALTRKFRLDPDLDLRSIAEKCPFNYTGADFYALCSDAMLNAMSRKAEEIEEKLAQLNAQPGPYVHPHPITPQYYLAELAKPDEILVYVSKRDFERALDMLVPSVSQAEMEHYALVQKRFSKIKEENETESANESKGKGKGKAREA